MLGLVVTELIVESTDRNLPVYHDFSNKSINNLYSSGMTHWFRDGKIT
jgi:hypothetical protein